MSDEIEPDAARVRRTFLAESIRAVAAGIIETAFATFAILILVTEFQSGAAIKALILASPALGLLGSLFIIPLVTRSQMSASRAAGLISLTSMLGFAWAAWNAQSEIHFIVGITLGLGIVGMAIPLQTHYLRINYPSRNRGRLFSAAVFIRAGTAMLVSWGFGAYLDKDLSRYPVLLWVFVAAAAVSAICHFFVPSEPLRGVTAKRNTLGDAVRLTSGDKIFVQILIASMILGFGVLSARALQVDYLANPIHGLEFDVMTVSLITGIIPSVVRLVSTFFWGWLFDRIDFFKLRIIVNFVFLAGVILYFMWEDPRIILIGSALFGLGRGGGEILFNLFVTKLTASENIADYMSVHTFLAGVRILLAPFLGFYLVQYANIDAMVVLSVALVLASIWFVRRAGRMRKALVPEDPAATDSSLT